MWRVVRISRDAATGEPEDGSTGEVLIIFLMLYLNFRSIAET